MALQVDVLRISARTADKIEVEHGLDPEAVRAAIEGVDGLPSRLKQGKNGLKAEIFTEIDGKVCLVVMYPAYGLGPSVWNLATAFPVGT